MNQLIRVQDNPLKRKVVDAKLLIFQEDINQPQFKRAKYDDCALEATIPDNELLLFDDSVSKLRSQLINKKRGRKACFRSPSPIANFISPLAILSTPPSPCATDLLENLITPNQQPTPIEEGQDLALVIPSSSVHIESTKSTHDWEFIPSHLLCYILAYLTQPQIVSSAMRVCTHWYEVAKSSQQLWRKMDFVGFKVTCTEDMINILDRLTIKWTSHPFSSSTGNQSMSLAHDDEKQECGNSKPYRIKHDGELMIPKSCNIITADHLKKLSSIVPNITSITFPIIEHSDSIPIKSISDSSLKQLSTFSQLRQLNLSTHNRITNVGIDYFFKKIKSLSNVSLDHCNKLTKQSLINILDRSHHLRSISMLNNTCLVDNQCLHFFCKRKTTLSSIRMELDLNNIDITNWTHFVENCKNIETLFIRVHDVKNNVHDLSELISITFKHLKKLKHFSLSCATQHIRIQSARMIHSELLTLHLTHCESLINPTIDCPKLNQIFFDHIKSWDACQMSHLTISNLNQIRIRSTNIKNLHLSEWLKNACTNLHDFELFDCMLSNVELQFCNLPKLEKACLFMCNNLQELIVDGCDSLHTLSVDVCMELRSMNVKSDSLQIAQFFLLPQMQHSKLINLELKCKNLQTLNLHRAVLLERAIIHCDHLDSLNLAGCKRLSHLDLRCDNLDKLALGSQILQYDEEWIDKVTEMCPLVTMLSLSDADELNDFGLMKLTSGFVQLRALVLNHCNKLVHPTIRGDFVKGLQITDCEHLKNVDLKLPHLYKLFIRNCKNISCDFLSRAGVTCPNIGCMEIFDCDALNVIDLCFQKLTNLLVGACKFLTQLKINCGQLNKITINHCPVLDRIDTNHSQLLCEITLHQCASIIDKSISLIHAPLLSNLIISKCDGVTIPDVRHFSNLKMLKFISCHSLEQVHIHSILQLLSFSNCKKLLLDGSFLSNSVVDVVEVVNCSNLRQLNIDCELKRLVVGGCSNLQYLNVKKHCDLVQVNQCNSSLQAINVDTLELQVNQCEELRSIQASNSLRNVQIISCMRISDLCITSLLNKCDRLTRMFVERCNLTCPVIKHDELTSLVVKHCPNLHKIKVEGNTRLQEYVVTDCCKFRLNQ
ncbi:hypothetical protein AKO1_007126 [Acrasis kona]|uniref:F-box domain-containing protein n=1 Tax=Acrasis kona TaxID=1008807 RepID=A0AAW2YSB2_9EUKA